MWMREGNRGYASTRRPAWDIKGRLQDLEAFTSTLKEKVKEANENVSQLQGQLVSSHKGRSKQAARVDDSSLTGDGSRNVMHDSFVECWFSCCVDWKGNGGFYIVGNQRSAPSGSFTVSTTDWWGESVMRNLISCVCWKSHITSSCSCSIIHPLFFLFHPSLTYSFTPLCH